MTTRRVVVDDNDTSRIIYGEGWTRVPGDDSPSSSGPTFLGGQHTTQGNSNFKFSFSGSAIEIYGTNDLQTVNGTEDQYDPRWTCLVDGHSIHASIEPGQKGHNFKLCDGSSLGEDPHTLVLQVTSRGANFSFDRIMYTPPSNVETADILWVSGQDLGFSFSDGWSQGNENFYSNVYGATVSYNFTGSHLMWFGPILADASRDATTGEYTIDGSTHQFKLDGLSPEVPHTANATWNNQLFFTTQPLPIQLHPIQVTYTGDHSTPLSLSYVYVFNATFKPAPPPPSPPQLPGIPPSSSSLPNSSAPPSAGHKGHPPIGAIVGAVVGMLVLLLIFLFFFIRRWRKNKSSSQTLSITEYWSNHFSQERDSSSFEPYPIIVTTTRTVRTDESNTRRRDSLSPLDRPRVEGGEHGAPTSWNQLRKSFRRSRGSLKYIFAR